MVVLQKMKSETQRTNFELWKFDYSQQKSGAHDQADQSDQADYRSAAL